jgi:hypothetical protein
MKSIDKTKNFETVLGIENIIRILDWFRRAALSGSFFYKNWLLLYAVIYLIDGVRRHLCC